MVVKGGKGKTAKRVELRCIEAPRVDKHGVVTKFEICEVVIDGKGTNTQLIFADDLFRGASNVGKPFKAEDIASLRGLSKSETEEILNEAVSSGKI